MIKYRKWAWMGAFCSHSQEEELEELDAETSIIVMGSSGLLRKSANN